MKRWTTDIDKLVFTHVVLIGVPTLFCYCLRLSGSDLLNWHLAIATIYLLSSVITIVESTNALFLRFATNEKRFIEGRVEQFLQLFKVALGVSGAKRPQPRQPLPKCSFVVVAYLPNEQDIILETLKHILVKVQRPPAGLELILAYNTPVDLPIEDDLRLLAEFHPELRLLKVEGSRSKAENLNAALEAVTGEITCILDADHQPCPDCFVRAWRWLERDYDVVQGRNVIRNHPYNFLTETIAIEFESLYGVSHAAKSFLSDTSIFGGSNGYWRTTVLRRIRFNPTMLTEDIDASLRTLLSGYRILHDRSIIATELAPTDLSAFWFQRKRWAHGWLEVSLRYQLRVLQSRRFTLWQKIYWTYLLLTTASFTLVSLQILPIILSSFLFQGTIASANNTYLWFSTAITFLSGVYQALVTMKIAYIRYPLRYFFQYSLFVFFYTVLKNIISVVAVYDYLHGHSEWVVTPRKRREFVSRPRQRSAALASGSSRLTSTKS
ncbi:glycosyl transferase [Leptolyngbya sp. 'hensonii']|uniref:glycosyltransferase family 2 protein n=1 Tax=Leptolyngbya sp. 'hensonii' TaxID=1922337 RepID=UPI00094FAF04|nr:glycosyltransferase [Leptolyngbya sp. 'hensonii']OLP17168.1 glycosyl transferase [Leptolyngbya sp. 'hensonii']